MASDAKVVSPNTGEGINRHRWISLALQTPALRRCDDLPWYEPGPDETSDTPTFELAPPSELSAPRLFWAGGEVVVRYIESTSIPHLRAIDMQLDGHLVDENHEPLYIQRAESEEVAVVVATTGPNGRVSGSTPTHPMRPGSWPGTLRAARRVTGVGEERRTCEEVLARRAQHQTGPALTSETSTPFATLTF